MSVRERERAYQSGIHLQRVSLVAVNSKTVQNLEGKEVYPAWQIFTKVAESLHFFFRSSLLRSFNL